MVTNQTCCFGAVSHTQSQIRNWDQRESINLIIVHKGRAKSSKTREVTHTCRYTVLVNIYSPLTMSMTELGIECQLVPVYLQV